MHNDSLPPTDRPETQAVFPANELLRAKFIADRDANGWSLNWLAKRLGVSTTQVSLYCHDAGNRYNGDTMALERRIEDFLRNESRRRASGVPNSTCDVSREIFAALEYTRKTNGVAEVFAESGRGKTRALEMYVQENPTAILLPVRAWTRDAASVATLLFSATARSGYDGRTKRMEWVVAKLAGSDRLVIVDDAHKLTRPALQVLFDLWDATHCPLALVGTFALQTVLEDDAQRSSRVGLAFAVTGGNPRSLVRHMVRSLAVDIGAEEQELIDLAESVVETHGHFRSVHQQLKLAVELKSAKPALAWTAAWKQAATLMPARTGAKGGRS